MTISCTMTISPVPIENESLVSLLSSKRLRSSARKRLLFPFSLPPSIGFKQTTSIVPPQPLTKRQRTGNGRTKSVRFADNVSNECIEKCTTKLTPMNLHGGDSTVHNIESTWIQTEEYAKIHKGNYDTLMALKKANGRFTEVDPNQFCFRGLESYITVYLYKGLHTARLGPKRLVEYQDALRRDGHCCDPELLRFAAESFSRKDQIKAIRIAWIDSISLATDV